MRILSLVSYLPLTILGLIYALLSFPIEVRINGSPIAIIFSVKSFWWYTWIPAKKGVRGFSIGNVVVVGPHADDKDLIHELIHIKQHEREPFIYPFKYLYQSWKYGYRNNKYEIEAYDKSGSRYMD